MMARVEQVINESLNDPDLRDRSADYKLGYARGMREALHALVRRAPPPPRMTLDVIGTTGGKATIEQRRA